MFLSIDEHVASAGGAWCTFAEKHVVMANKPHVLCLSPPCQPFSDAREKTGKTKRTGDVRSHPLCDVPTSSSLRLIFSRDAEINFVEEVVTWNRIPKGMSESPMQTFINAIRHRWPGIAVQQLDCNPYMVGSRPLLFMIAVKESSGGQNAANEWSRIVDTLNEHRRAAGPPTPLVHTDGNTSGVAVLSPDIISELKDMQKFRRETATELFCLFQKQMKCFNFPQTAC